MPHIRPADEYVIDGDQPATLEALKKLQQTENLTIITLAKKFGESTALSTAFGEMSGEIIIFTHAKDLKEYKIDKIIN